MIKGHARIELTSVADGSKKIIEHDNVFQSGVLAKYMRSLGEFNSSPYSNSTWAGQKLWRNLCGGILLFRDAIDTSGGEVEYMPAGNQMTANGAYGVTNAGTPVELGTYNALESVEDGSSTVTFVYDWGTSQGNGTISCVCLTSEVGGYIGYGNPSGERASEKSLFSNQSSADKGGVIWNNARWEFSVDVTNSVLTVTKTPCALTQATIFDGLAKASETYSFSGYSIGGNTLYNAHLNAVYLNNNKVAILYSGYNSTLHNNETYYFLIFNLSTHAFEQGTIINTTGENLSLDGSFNYRAIGFDDNYAYLYKDYSDVLYKQTPIYVFDYTTGALETTLLSEAGLVYSQNYSMGKLTDELMWLAGYIYDAENESIYPTNGASNPGGYSYNSLIDAMSGSQYQTYKVYKNPLYLATVNNLNEPVIKDNTQTMKVIYTLTEVAE